MSKRLSFFVGLCFTIFFISTTLFSVRLRKNTVGVKNFGNSFVKQICQKYDLKLYERTETGTKGKKYVFREYRNPKKGIIIFFQQSPNKPEENYLNSICMFTTSESKALELASYFISHLGAKSKDKTRWKTYLKKVSYSLKGSAYVERGKMPFIRCLAKKHVKPGQRGSVYYFELTVMGDRI